MSLPTVGEIIESVVGGDFEIPCREIQVILRAPGWHPEPVLFTGAGYLRSKNGGEIHYELLDQRARSSHELERLKQWLASGSNSFVVEAESYSGLSWLGHWHVPDATWAGTAGAIVRGRFPQITADFDSEGNSTRRITTVLHYGGVLGLPPHTSADGMEVRYRDGTVRFESRYGYTTATVFDTGIEGPLAEAWLDETLSFLLGHYVRHRVALRYLEKRTIMFVRHSDVQTSTGMPKPVSLPDQTEAFREIFVCYLAHCAAHDNFSPPCNLSAVWCEVLLASTGTVHSFVFALVAAIESVAREILAITETEAQDTTKSLLDHVAQWKGDEKVKQRAIGMLSQLSAPSMRRMLEKLRDEGVLTDEQLKTWNALRNKLAHGQVLDYFHADVAQWRGELIDLVYRLALRRIGYRGKFFSHAAGVPTELIW